MRQINVELQENDPLKRIQKEINDIARREQELRELSSKQAVNSQTQNNNNNNNNGHDLSVMSDDSGISSSSSPVNGTSSNIKEISYIRSNTINPTSSQIYYNQTMPKLTRTLSTPQIYVPNKRFTMNSGVKGIMQRFIASRGRIAANGNRFPDSILTSTELNRPPTFLPSAEITPPIIERDEDGRPLRKGYVPVEEKIQKELRDLKTRESELKRLRRKNNLRQSQPDLLDDIDDSMEFDSADESDEEHCFGPGKLRSSKSISELCDTLNSTSSFSPRETPSPQLYQRGVSSGLRPAVSLAQLCDVDPDEAPSSHRLIAQWENIIMKKQQEVA